VVLVEVVRKNLHYYRTRLTQGDEHVTYLIAMDIQTLERFMPLFPGVAAALLALRRDLIALCKEKPRPDRSAPQRPQPNRLSGLS
jgi:hypothetical protein